MGSRLYKRVFLNPLKAEGIAAAQLSWKQTSESEHTAGLTITDCNRQVVLDFDYWTPIMKKHRLFKIDTLVKLLLELREKIEKSEVKRY